MLGMVVQTFDPSTQEADMWISEFETSLVYRVRLASYVLGSKAFTTTPRSLRHTPAFKSEFCR